LRNSESATIDRAAAEPLVTSRWKTDLKFALLCLLVTVLFYWKIILVRQYSLLLDYEPANQAYAWFNFWASTIKQGIWPIWDPFTFSGHAFAGEMQTGAFYPPYLLFAVVPLHDGLFSPQLYHMFYVLTHAFCAWLMYLFARELGLSAFAGFIAGICFSLGGAVARLSGWPHLLQSGIWLPVIVLLLIRALKAIEIRRAAAYAALSGLTIAMAILAGGLHFVIMQALVAVGIVVFYTANTLPAISQARTWPAWRRAAILITICGAFAFCGGAVQLLPSTEYSQHALRYLGYSVLPATQRIPYTLMRDSLYPYSFVGLLIPAFAGSASSGEYINPYIGVFPLLLAIIGTWKQWACLWVRFLAGLAVIAYLYSLGALSLLHGLLYALTPFLWMAREANRFMYLADFALAILAGFGADQVFRVLPAASWEPLSRVLRYVAIAGIAVLAWFLVIGHGDPSPWIALSILLILLSYGMFLSITRGNQGRWACFLIVALICFDLSAFDWSPVNKIEAESKGHDQMERLLSLRGAAKFLRSRPGPFRVQLLADSPPNIGDVFGIPETMGTGATIQADYDHFRRHADLLNTRYTIRPATASDPGAVYQDAAWKIYENATSYPRAWLVHETVVEPDPNKLVAKVNAPDLNFREVAVVDRPLDTAIDMSINATNLKLAGNEQAEFRQVRPDKLDIVVHADHPGLLVLSELFYPGWHATVNGMPARIWKVDGALRGVVVPSGESRVSMYYSPASFMIGMAVSIAAFVCGALLAFGLKRSRRQPATS
jgi:hypothetical protein